ncbi:DUF5610 domain-containing protein [Herbaspirillum sp. RV1423]|uniref:DUF5610 domain-containing protein n=1 Tax=Herbaspirillum sp. RV1423 TaxID=1443993 RepID=UPI0004BB9F7C|nr:DUF5610 domain-containing protein [Herbaspirillum sp. RV1423]
MSISTNDLNTLNTLNTQTSPASTPPATSGAAGNASQTGNADDAKQVKLTPQLARQQLNASILQASLEVSITSQNDPLALVYKSAIENLNDILKPQLGDNAIQNAASQDNSPEATAGRIVSFIKSAYAMYSQVNPMNPDGSTADNFLSLIQAGVDKGFDEARGILASLQVLNGDIASNIDKTYDLVKKGLADFAASLKAPATGDNGSAPATGDGSGSTSSTTVSVSISITASRTETVTY